MPRQLRSLSILIVSILALPLAAQVADEQAIKDVENSKFSTSGIINSNAVYIRCGPGENYYPTQKLDKGAKVTVVGVKFDWLKVVPPDGSFCYVAKLYVDRHGDGKVGRVNKDSINVRAGSSLSALKIGILCELNQGEDVEILGEEQEYFKIKPPTKKAYLYVNKKFVDPDPDAKPQVQVAENTAPKTTDTPKATDTPKTTDTPAATDTKPEVASNNTNTTPGTETTKPEMTKPENAADSTKPEVATNDTPKTTDTPKPETTDTPKTGLVSSADHVDIETQFDKAEAAFIAARSLPLEQQPLDILVPQFEALSKSDKLPESMRRVAESRFAALKARQSAQTELLTLRKGQQDLKQQQMALEAEQQELQKRIAENTIKVYTAVGTLQPSSLQVGQGGTLYRITDPATGRTVCYLRSNEGKAVQLVGQFVGVKGTLADDQRLGARVITTPEIVACDPARVHHTVTAQIIPASMIPKTTGTANVDPSQP